MPEPGADGALTSPLESIVAAPAQELAVRLIRFERQQMEQMDYNLLYRWVVGLGIDAAVWDHSTYSKIRDRLLDADISRKFLKGILEHGEVKPLLSTEHFKVDGTLVNAWASLKELRAEAEANGRRPPVKLRAKPPSVSDKTTVVQPPTTSKSSRNAQEAGSALARQGRNIEVDFRGSPSSSPLTAAEAKLVAERAAKAAAQQAQRAARRAHIEATSDIINARQHPATEPRHQPSTASGSLGKMDCRWPFGDPVDPNFPSAAGRPRTGVLFVAPYASSFPARSDLDRIFRPNTA